MIASKQKEVFGILDLVAKQQQYGFETLLSAIHIVTKEKIIGIRWKASLFFISQYISVRLDGDFAS